MRAARKYTAREARRRLRGAERWKRAGPYQGIRRPEPASDDVAVGVVAIRKKGASGRDHNPAGFTAWLAGAGVKAPFSYGATDEFGYRAVENVSTVHDLYATVLHVLGLDHERTSYYHNGIERRLTDVEGHVLTDLLA